MAHGRSTGKGCLRADCRVGSNADRIEIGDFDPGAANSFKSSTYHADRRRDDSSMADFVLTCETTRTETPKLESCPFGSLFGRLDRGVRHPGYGHGAESAQHSTVFP